MQSCLKKPVQCYLDISRLSKPKEIPSYPQIYEKFGDADLNYDRNVFIRKRRRLDPVKLLDCFNEIDVENN